MGDRRRRAIEALTDHGLTEQAAERILDSWLEDLELAAMRAEIAQAVGAKRLEYDATRGLLFTAVSFGDGVRHYELTATPAGGKAVVFHDQVDEWSPNGWHRRICSIHVPGIRDMTAKEALQAASAAARNWRSSARRK